VSRTALSGHPALGVCVCVFVCVCICECVRGLPMYVCCHVRLPQYHLFNCCRSDSGTSETSANVEVPAKVSTTANLRNQSLQMLRDPDLDVDPEMPSIESFISKEQLRKLKPKERKRQEIINGQFYANECHLQILHVACLLFFYMLYSFDLCRPLSYNIQ